MITITTHFTRNLDLNLYTLLNCLKMYSEAEIFYTNKAGSWNKMSGKIAAKYAHVIAYADWVVIYQPTS